MNHLAFADAARPARCVILRLPMLDYSIGHEILLLREGNPLIVPDENATEEKYRVGIIRAALICSRTWGENQRHFRWFKLWQWLARHSDFSLAVADFHNYRRAGISMPEVMPTPGEKGRNLGAPHIARLLEYSMKLYGPAAFDMPFGLAQWMYYSGAESEGGCIIPSEEEKATQSAVEEMERTIRKEQEEKQWPRPD